MSVVHRVLSRVNKISFDPKALKETGREGTDWIYLKIGTSDGPFKYGNEQSGSTKYEEFLD
jgi:hypothetical protein